MDECTINIWIDGYDDLFSDFDSRSYSDRSLSDDFIAELKKLCTEKKQIISEIKLELPAGQRNLDSEAVVIRRLNRHIKNYNHYYKLELSRIKKRGALYLLTGFLLMVMASWIASVHEYAFLMNVLTIIFEPAGWFLVWTGFDLVFNTFRYEKRELDLYQKLAKTKIHFESQTVR